MKSRRLMLFFQVKVINMARDKVNVKVMSMTKDKVKDTGQIGHTDQCFDLTNHAIWIKMQRQICNVYFVLSWPVNQVELCGSILSPGSLSATRSVCHENPSNDSLLLSYPHFHTALPDCDDRYSGYYSASISQETDITTGVTVVRGNLKTQNNADMIKNLTGYREYYVGLLWSLSKHCKLNLFLVAMHGKY